MELSIHNTHQLINFESLSNGELFVGAHTGKPTGNSFYIKVLGLIPNNCNTKEFNRNGEVRNVVYGPYDKVIRAKFNQAELELV